MPRTTKPLKICIIDEFTEGGVGWIASLKLRHTVVSRPEADCDVILCGSINVQDKAHEAMLRLDIPVVTYCWDFYQWAWEGKNPYYDWNKYAGLLQKSHRILVPSHGQQRRLRELFDLPSSVAHCGIDTYDAKTEDKRFVLDPVRYYPEENRDWVVRACEELGIPVIHSEHQFSKEEFQNLVNTCSFMTCGYREASTGGLTLMEGLWNGKASLVSDSPYMGARDYLGDFGYYFKHDDFDDLKRWINYLWEHPPMVDIAKVRKYMQRFTHDHFAKRVEQELYDLLS